MVVQPPSASGHRYRYLGTHSFTGWSLHFLPGKPGQNPLKSPKLDTLLIFVRIFLEASDSGFKSI